VKRKEERRRGRRIRRRTYGECPGEKSIHGRAVGDTHPEGEGCRHYEADEGGGGAAHQAKDETNVWDVKTHEKRTPADEHGEEEVQEGGGAAGGVQSVGVGEGRGVCGVGVGEGGGGGSGV
jgi:hypothetical protein